MLLLWLGVLLRLCLGPLLLWLCLGTLLLWCSSASRNHGSNRFACRDGFARRQNGRTPVVDGGELLVVLRRHTLVLQLRGHGRNALLPQCGGFGRHGSASDASGPVVAGAVVRSVGDGAVININVVDVYIVDRTVIAETISGPVPALIADAAIAESIVNAAVVADIWAPKAVVEAIDAD